MKPTSKAPGWKPTPPWRSQPRTTLAPKDELPEGYGDWEDWNDAASILLEDQMARAHQLRFSQRGPPPPAVSGIALWNDVPYNNEKKAWQCWTRDMLPAAYAFDDWWSQESLQREAELAHLYRIPHSLRGPPNGPQFPGQTWRDLEWRPRSKKWMSRGGLQKADHDARYGKASSQAKASRKP